MTPGPVRVVVSHHDARPATELVALLDQLAALPAGWPHETLVVVNRSGAGRLELPARHRHLPLLERENTGWNLGAWEAGWRAAPARDAFLFLQDECRLLAPGWLAPFVELGARPGVGLVGERLNPAWSHPWDELERRLRGHRLPDHEVDGRPADRLETYRHALARWGVPLGATGRHLQSLVLYARRDTLERARGFEVGRTKGEAIAAELSISKKIETLGLEVLQVDRAPFRWITHPQWAGRDPGSPSDPVHVYVGTDRSQLLAARVLEHSLRRRTSAPVVVTRLLDVPARDAKDPRQGKRTGFSFARFLIPALRGRQGRALYLDADMLVFGDVRELWELPFEGARVVIQEDLSEEEARARPGRPARRRRQWAVMLLDCARLDWDVDRIIDGLDEGRYTYDQLMHEFCILGPGDLRQAIPSRWNSLERHDASTSLLHYTDVVTQPWTSTRNPLDHLWLDEARLMLRTGALTWDEVRREVAAGHLRPSLLRDLRLGHRVPAAARPAWRRLNAELDRRAGYVAHRDVLARERARRALAT